MNLFWMVVFLDLFIFWIFFLNKFFINKKFDIKGKFKVDNKVVIILVMGFFLNRLMIYFV